MNKEITVATPPNKGWLDYRLNKKEMDYVWRCIENKKHNCNSSLEGNITGSYNLMDRGDWFWMNVISPLINCYKHEFGNSLQQSIPTSNGHPLCLSRWWVNYQKQNEFNPLHHHSGVYSFVIWMKIPFKWEEQNKKDIAEKSNSPSIATFQFVHPNIVGELTYHRYELSPEDEGLLVFFPSQLNHQVYPFYDCDEDRISVSGNVSLNTTKII